MLCFISRTSQQFANNYDFLFINEQRCAFYPYLEHLPYKIVHVMSYVIVAINSLSLTSLFFFSLT